MDDEEYEQQCEACGEPFEASEETSLCPSCEEVTSYRRHKLLSQGDAYLLPDSSDNHIYTVLCYSVVRPSILLCLPATYLLIAYGTYSSFG